MIETLIGAGCYLAFWSNAGGFGPAARPLIFVCLALASLLAVATGKVRRIAAAPIEILLYLIAVLSAAVSLVRAEEYCIYYTMYYLATLVLTSIVTRVVSIPRLMDVGAYVTLACLATSVALNPSGLIAALKVSVGAHGLERFSALNNHPLLMGYIFGSGSILLARRIYLARGALERTLMAIGVLGSWTIVLAASSRSATIALMAAAAFALLVEFRALRGLTVGRFAAAAAVIGVLVGVYFSFASDYLTRILELDSVYRGFGSGATGRTDLWTKGLESLTADPTLVAFGGGLRSSEYSVIGFLTENSYITILLDSGVLFGSALILFMLYTPLRALRMGTLPVPGTLPPVKGTVPVQGRMPAQKNVLALYAAYFVFLLIQCFFLRYFIGIGNPTSLMTLFFMVSLPMYPGFQAQREETAISPVHASPPGRLARAKI
jgi:exopolysaccharide production protein ExoQ